MEINTWPFSVSSDYQGKGIGFVPTVATVERKTQYGYEFVEDPETNERGYKRTWSGPRGRWNEDAGRSDPYTGPEFAPGQKVSLYLSQRDATNKEGQPVTYHNINGIRLAEPDAGGTGGPAAQMGVRQPEAAPTAPETPAAPVQTTYTAKDQSILKQVGFKAAVELLCAKMGASKTAWDPFTEETWKDIADDVWLSYNYLMRGKNPERLYDPEEPETPAEEDASEVVEQADAHLSDVPPEEDVQSHDF